MSLGDSESIIRNSSRRSGRRLSERWLATASWRLTFFARATNRQSQLHSVIGIATTEKAVAGVEIQWSAIAQHLKCQLDEQRRAVELHSKARRIVNALDYEMTRFNEEVGYFLQPPHSSRSRQPYTGSRIASSDSSPLAA